MVTTKAATVAMATLGAVVIGANTLARLMP
jgi:hypothetical protein